jgi:hypothetical protein
MINPAVFATTFLAAAVEIVEMVIIVVGVSHPRLAVDLGCGSGLGILAALILALGMALTLVPIGVLRLVVGSLLFVFGLQWLRRDPPGRRQRFPRHGRAGRNRRRHPYPAWTGPLGSWPSRVSYSKAWKSRSSSSPSARPRGRSPPRPSPRPPPS